MKKQIKAQWLENESRENLQFILAEYRFLVHRFMQWIGLTFGKSSNERVRQLLLHNIIDECGRIGGDPSHLSYLDDCLASCGVVASEHYKPRPSTRRIEKWFFDVYQHRDCHVCLSVLGPGTESISQQFLKPLEAGLRHAFAGQKVDYKYFDVHRPEVEIAHAEDIAKALAIVEQSTESAVRKKFEKERIHWAEQAIAHHAEFWTSLKEKHKKRIP
jgi:pyrroloquinoline quinone (PQQ) biosynthesis protein C